MAAHSLGSVNVLVQELNGSLLPPAAVQAEVSQFVQDQNVDTPLAGHGPGQLPPPRKITHRSAKWTSASAPNSCDWGTNASSVERPASAQISFRRRAT